MSGTIGNEVNPVSLDPIIATVEGQLSVDGDQSFTDAQKSQGRANLAVDATLGFRNKIINGDFDIWQRATTQTISGYGSDDRWNNLNNGSTKTASRQTFALGQTDVLGDPTYYSRTVVSSITNAANFVSKSQFIEGVKTLQGKKATLTFYAKADASKNIAVEFSQSFGTGGSPSSAVTGIAAQLVALTTSWQKFSLVVDVPSIAGKTLGSNNNDYLAVNFWFEAGSNYAARAASLGQQSGTFDIAHVSLVLGDATQDEDPFTPRHIQQELALCLRYFETGRYGFISYQLSGQGFGHHQPLLSIKRTSPTLITNIVSVSNVTSPSLVVALGSNAVTCSGVATASGTVVLIVDYSADAELT